MEDPLRTQLVPGARAIITQQIPMRDRVWTAEVRGQIVAYEQRPTGSWFAHSRDDTLWLDRLVVRKDDGEISTLNLDEYTRIEVQPAPAEIKAETKEEETPAASA